MPIRVKTSIEYPKTPWKNGGGVTCEIARADESTEPDWRISLATIDRDGPFSDFSGYDRTIVPVGGAGFVLDFEDGETHELVPLLHNAGGLSSLSFAGERKVVCRLLSGASQDVNVMSFRSRWRHHVDVSILSAQPAHLDLPPMSFLFAIGEITVVHPRGVIEARSGTTVSVDRRTAVNVRTNAAKAALLVIRLHRRWSLW